MNSERYLATHHCYPSDKNVNRSHETFRDKYLFTLMSILNTKHGVVDTDVLVRRNGDGNGEINETIIAYHASGAMNPSSREHNWKSR
ncbi:hypothetical protein MTR_6g075850 [Medicago truncatula]|uniref:Uncharacterized protein n=1 Tax=Medicago truncatula TaxID=3880 RepID=G7KJR0_MEDTR|nr:hypothetical protein MTR_6g075850 [Medicago truncatula]